jgi:hypothetical protein
MALHGVTLPETASCGVTIPALRWTRSIDPV